jgi:hypothetical protein
MDDMPTLDLGLPPGLTPEIRKIIEAAPRPGLGAGRPSVATRQEIEDLIGPSSGIGEASAGTYPAGPPLAPLPMAALWLLAGELERSHAISQHVESSSGSYWHGIMHRREGDFLNSKYWFRRVGQHPVLQQLAQQISEQREHLEQHGLPCQDLVRDTRVAEAYIDLCQAAQSSQTAWLGDLELIGWWEWQLLFKSSLALAIQL